MLRPPPQVAEPAGDLHTRHGVLFREVEVVGHRRGRAEHAVGTPTQRIARQLVRQLQRGKRVPLGQHEIAVTVLPPREPDGDPAHLDRTSAVQGSARRPRAAPAPRPRSHDRTPPRSAGTAPRRPTRRSSSAGLRSIASRNACSAASGSPWRRWPSPINSSVSTGHGLAGDAPTPRPPCRRLEAAGTKPRSKASGRGNTHAASREMLQPGGGGRRSCRGTRRGGPRPEEVSQAGDLRVQLLPDRGAGPSRR